MSPHKLVEKPGKPGKPTKYRFVEDNSFPYTKAKPTELPAVNADLDLEQFPARFHSFETMEDHSRNAADCPEARELHLDKKAAFEVIPLHPSIRHRLIVIHHDKAYIRKNAPFGL